MKIFYLYKDSQRESTCDVTAQGLIDSFSSNGCIPLSETEFLREEIQPSQDDVVIVYISIKNEKCHEKLRRLNCKKILQSVDESKSDEILFRTQLEFCDKHNIRLMINTYPSERNISFLREKNINTITLPICSSPRYVDTSKKDIDVLVSGQLDPNYYPIRFKIFSALRKSSIKFAHLPHSGMESSNVIHQYHGKKFLDLLDRCWLGVTCRAGTFRDRMVAKYVEFGFCKVLPIGDCPSYMDQIAKSSMIEVNEKSSDNHIIEQIEKALSNKENLVSRIERYSSIIRQNHDMDVNVKRVVSMVKEEKTDS